ncbi:hypothetical protein J6590_018518 [Homalodisca vitripennis]|nr:hypothetical protein J6590_018518 [Homalodisca vitripennis]
MRVRTHCQSNRPLCCANPSPPSSHATLLSTRDSFELICSFPPRNVLGTTGGYELNSDLKFRKNFKDSVLRQARCRFFRKGYIHGSDARKVPVQLCCTSTELFVVCLCRRDVQRAARSVEVLPRGGERPDQDHVVPRLQHPGSAAPILNCLLFVCADVMSNAPLEVWRYFHEVGNDLTKITWFHACNTRALLHQALASK